MVIRHISKSESGTYILWTQAGILTLKNLNDRLVPVSNGITIKDVYSGPDQTNYLYGTITPLQIVILKSRSERIIDTINLPSILKMKSMIFGSILEDTEGCLWIASFEKGIFVLKNSKIFRHFEIKEGQTILQDHDHNIWVSSMCQGVYCFSPFINKIEHHQNSINTTPGITAMADNPEGGIWCTDGKSVCLYRNKGFFSSDNFNTGGPFNRIRFLKDRTIIVWQKGSYCSALKGISLNLTSQKIFFKKIVQSVKPVKEIAVDSSGLQLASFSYTNLYLFPKAGFPERQKRVGLNERIFSVFYNAQNELVVNAGKNYCYRNGNLIPEGKLQFVNNRIITDHLVLNDSLELVNLEGDSLLLYSGTRNFNLSKTFELHISRQIRHVEYKSGLLFLVTASNLFVCDDPIRIWQGKPAHMKFFDLSFKDIRDLIIKNDTIYIANENGLTVIPRTMLDAARFQVPIPYFRSVSIDNQNLLPSNMWASFRGNKSIKLIFGSINFSSHPTIYSYKLEGAEKDWIIGPGDNVTYQNLSPGTYVFMLKARKGSADWSKPIEFQFKIRSTVWQHPLFLTSIFIIIALIIALAILMQKNRQIKKRELDTQLVTLEQKALQSMMNPHFIFNVLGSIQSYLLQNMSKEAGLFLSQFARLIRQNMNAILSSNINLEDEVDRLINYLDLEKIRMGNKFNYIIDVSENLDAEEILIPSMIIQPFVENAIWHGISNIEDKGEIIIKFRKNDERSLKIIIKDNGIGMSKSPKFKPKGDNNLHLGMEMTRRRLELLGKKYSLNTSIEYCEAFPGHPNPGTRIVLIVPITNSTSAYQD